MPSTKIAIIEDELVIAANISLQLTELGYEVTGIVPRGAEAILHIWEEKPDVVLMDINLKGEMDGIETARRIKKEADIPIIFLTANADDAHFKKAQATNPHGFISKPFKKKDLERTIALTLSRVASEKERITSSTNLESRILKDAIFIKQHEKMIKILITDILYLQADRNYCKISTQHKEHLLVATLKDLEQKLPEEHFLRVHRSYVINLSKIDILATSHLVINNKAIPVSKTYKEELLRRLQTI